MKKKILQFFECEHRGDLDNYIGDIVRCGGQVLSSVVYPDEEMGIVVAMVDPTFIGKFNETDAFQFLDSFTEA